MYNNIIIVYKAWEKQSELNWKYNIIKRNMLFVQMSIENSKAKHQFRSKAKLSPKSECIWQCKQSKFMHKNIMHSDNKIKTASTEKDLNADWTTGKLKS